MIARTDWTVNSLATELGLDRRTLAKRLSGLEPVSTATIGKRTERHYRLAAVIEHLAGGDTDLDLSRERALLTRLQQDRLKLELAELRGELVRAPAIGAHWQAMVMAMRARLLSLPATIATKVAGPDSLAKVQGMVQDLVHEALAEIGGDGFPDEVRRRLVALRESGDGR